MNKDDVLRIAKEMFHGEPSMQDLKPYLDFAARLEVEWMKGQEPVAWSITMDGEHTGNMWLSEYTAGTKMDELNLAYPMDKRALVPLYLHTAPIPSTHCVVPKGPTADMNRAADKCACTMDSIPKGFWYWGHIYKAMIAAAQGEK
jgi:hypothetical protein